jgi:hypothetical protein
MADQPRTSNRRDHPLRIVANGLIDALDARDAVDGVTKAANESGLPQGEGGPADAYRHLLIAGELRRRFGPAGAILTWAYEFLNRLEGQSELNRRMDDINNAVVHNARDFRTFEDLQLWARGKVTEAAPFNGDGLDGRLMWHRKPARGWRPGWSNVPLISIERGGAEHHWGPRFGSGVPGEIAAADPLDRVLAAWSREDIGTIMQSEAYRRSSHPHHAQAQALVRAWFERNHGDRPAPRDATRRIDRPVPRRRGSAERAVHVRAHTREGGKERVRAHARSWPD